MYTNPPHKTAISPVIGIMLLVLLTVLLVSITAIIIFEIGEDTSQTALGAVQLTETNNGIKVDYIQSDNINNITIIGPEDEKTINNIGTHNVSKMGSGTYTVIANLEDNSEQVLKSKTITNIESTDGETTVNGYVETNPRIEGATIQAIKNEEIIKSTTTDENGEYNITLKNTNDVELIADTNGTTVEINNEMKNFYAKATRSIGQKTTVNFIFPLEDTTTIENETIAKSVSEGEISDKYINKKFIEISTLEELQSINEKLNENYIVVDNIDGSNSDELNDGSGFEPIGDADNKFNGTLDGQRYEIQNIMIESDNASIFKNVGESGKIENIGLINSSIEGDLVGGLVLTNSGLIRNSYTVANISANTSAGGLVDFNDGEIHNSYTMSQVETTNDIYSFSGGIVSNNNGLIKNSYSLSNVQGSDFNTEETASGGIAGVNDNNGEIKKSYSAGDVENAVDEGGIAGWNNNGEIKDSYWNKNKTEDGIGETDGSKENVIGLEPEQMKDLNSQDNMTKLDFTNKWISVTNDYPALQWQE